MNITAVVIPVREEDRNFKYTVTFRSQDFTYVTQLRDHGDNDQIEQIMQQLQADRVSLTILYRSLAFGNRIPKGATEEYLREGWRRAMDQLALKTVNDWRAQIDELRKAIEVWMDKPKRGRPLRENEDTMKWMKLDSWEPDFMAYEYASNNSRGNYRLGD